MIPYLTQGPNLTPFEELLETTSETNLSCIWPTNHMLLLQSGP
jgi:hypothetical protein